MRDVQGETPMTPGTEHRPGDLAPVPGLYYEVNVFGTPTGRSVQVGHGEPLPEAPRGFGWRMSEGLGREGTVLR